jgi:hypothetical protein
MRERFIVRSVVPNKGGTIKQIHLAHDVYRDEFSQPTEILMNTPSDIFQVGDEWVVRMTLIRRQKPRRERL